MFLLVKMDSALSSTVVDMVAVQQRSRPQAVSMALVAKVPTISSR